MHLHRRNPGIGVAEPFDQYRRGRKVGQPASSRSTSTALQRQDAEAIIGLVRGSLPDPTFLTKELWAPVDQVQRRDSGSLRDRQDSDFKLLRLRRDNAPYLTTITGLLYVKGRSPATPA